MWKDSLRKASFKGIEFHVEEHEAVVGRRIKTHEYPFKDKPFTEDLGAKAKRHNIQAYFVGKTYNEERDALLFAIEQGGVGVLIHPYLGTKYVHCETGSLRETRAQGGICTITMTMVEEGPQDFPVQAPFALDKVLEKADALISAASGDFTDNVSLTGFPEWVRDDYKTGIQSVGAIFKSVQAQGFLNKQVGTELINKAATIVANITDLVSAPGALISDVKTMASRFVETFDGLLELAPSNKDAGTSLKSFSEFSTPKSTALTETAQVINKNADALENLIKTLALANETKATVRQTFTSYEDALETRESILARIDTLAMSTTSDVIYESVRNLRAEVAAAIPDSLENLPRLGHIKLKQERPALVVAYDLYNNIENETDLINRNKIKHPGFVPGGEDLSVLQYDSSST